MHYKRPPTFGRRSNRGAILPAVLISLIVLTSLVGLVQMRSVANAQLSARLTEEVRTAIGRDAVSERLRGLIADQILSSGIREDRPSLNSVPFRINHAGQEWMVQVQDVHGLVNLATAPTAHLNALGGRRLEPPRDALDGQGEVSHLTMHLALAEIDPLDWPLFTQTSQAGAFRIDFAPSDLIRRLAPFRLQPRPAEQVKAVRIDIHTK